MFPISNKEVGVLEESSPGQRRSSPLPKHTVPPGLLLATIREAGEPTIGPRAGVAERFRMLAGGHGDTMRAAAVVDWEGLASTAIAASIIADTFPVDRDCAAIGDKGGLAAGHQRKVFDLLAVNSASANEDIPQNADYSLVAGVNRVAVSGWRLVLRHQSHVGGVGRIRRGEIRDGRVGPAFDRCGSA